MTRSKRTSLGILCCGFALALAWDAAGEGDPAADAWKSKAEHSASAYLGAFMRGDLEAATKHTALPFAWDGKVVVTTPDGLQSLHGAVLQEKGARELQLRVIETKRRREVLDDGCIPIDVIVVRGEISGPTSPEPHPVRICVQPNEPYRVIGWRD